MRGKSHAAVLLILLSRVGCGGGSAPETTVAPAVEKGNILKGMTVAVDVAGRRGFVAGIMTDNVGVVDLESKTLVRTFALANHQPTVKRLRHDPIHGRLWIASAKGEQLWILDAESGETLAAQDISDDTAADAGEYPLSDAALDPGRETFYLLRTDGASGRRVAVYNAALKKKTDILVGMQVVALRWDGERDALVALTAPPGGTGEILVLPEGREVSMTSVPAPGGGFGNPPSKLAVAEGGDYLVAGEAVWRVDATSGSVVWKAALPRAAAAVEVSGSEVGVLQQYGTSGSADEYVSRLVTFDIGSGALLAVRSARYEASRMAASTSVGGFIVGNGGDGSVSLFPAGTEEAATLSVGASAEDLLLTPDGNRVLVLNRLGGSQLIEKDLKTGETRAVDVGAWPMALRARPADDKLYVLSHFESKLTVLRLSTLETLGTISLGLSPAIGDTVSDLAADPEGSLLACLMCEKGAVVVVDGQTEQIESTIQFVAPATGMGPGRITAAVDGAKRRVYVYVPEEGKVYRLDGSTGYQIGASADSLPEPSTRGTYSIGVVYYSPNLDRLFVYNQVLDPETLQSVGSVSGIHRLVGEEKGILYAQDRDADGQEALITLDASTLEIVEKRDLVLNEKMASYVSFDFARRRLAFTAPADNRVEVTSLDE